MNQQQPQQQPTIQQQANTSQYDFGNIKPPPTGIGANQKPLQTAMRNTQAANRPMSSMNKANFNQQQKKDDPLGLTKTKLNLQDKIDSGAEEQYKKMEKEINTFIEDSAVANLKGNLSEALEKAKEAYNKEKNLRRLREQNNQIDSINLDLSYCAAFNLANQLQANEINQDALQKYNEIIKAKQYPQAGRLRVNMGNIYFQQEKYTIAIKMYRMALDLIPATSKEMRYKILMNIGHAFVKLGQFQEAINSYDTIMKGAPNFQIAFNLMLCLYALGDNARMKDNFIKMLDIQIPGCNDEGEEQANQDNQINDTLREDIKEKKRQAIKHIVDGAKLIAPVIENKDIVQGYEWILDQLKNIQFPEVQSEIEICKAMAYLKKKNIENSIETLKGFEKKDKVIMGRVATNISFLYFLEQDYKNAEKYAEIAITYDRYNAKALVNRGNCLFMKNEFLRAKEQYLEAIGVEADCTEALYNLAYVNKKINMFVESLQALEKLQTIISISEVIYQMATIHELMGNNKQALKWYQVLLTKVPTDPNILARVGSIFAREEEETQALHYYQESYRYLPTNIETISWLGIYYVKQELYERACHFFERASQVQPREIKWRLMVASCYRRMGSFQKALKMYEEIYHQEPDNLECLKFLTQLCKDMGLPYEEYAAQLKKKEREQEALPEYQQQEMEFANNQQQQFGQQYQNPDQMYQNPEQAQNPENNQQERQVNIQAQTRRPQQQQKTFQQANKNEEEEWKNDNLNDLLEM